MIPNRVLSWPYRVQLPKSRTMLNVSDRHRKSQGRCCMEHSLTAHGQAGYSNSVGVHPALPEHNAMTIPALHIVCRNRNGLGAGAFGGQYTTPCQPAQCNHFSARRLQSNDGTQLSLDQSGNSHRICVIKAPFCCPLGPFRSPAGRCGSLQWFSGMGKCPHRGKPNKNRWGGWYFNFLIQCCWFSCCSLENPHSCLHMPKRSN